MSRCIAYFDDSGALVAPDSALSSVLNSHGYFFFTSESRIEPQFAIAHRHRRAAVRMLDFWKIPIENRMLAVLESRVNEPFPYTKAAPKSYGKIIFSSHYHDSRPRELFGFAWNAPDIQTDADRQHRIAIVQANKFSSIRGECYSLRRRVIRDSIDKSIPLDVYGAGWQNSVVQNLFHAGKSDLIRLRQSLDTRSLQRPSWSRYRYMNTRQFGHTNVIENKFELLSRYRFSLVIENDREYVSEKVRDSLACGCVTFYLGPDVELLRDLPGLVRLSVDPRAILATFSSHLAQRGRTFPSPKQIRESALARFPHPSGKMWTGLANAWLQTYAR